MLVFKNFLNFFPVVVRVEAVVSFEGELTHLPFWEESYIGVHFELGVHPFLLREVCILMQEGSK